MARCSAAGRLNTSATASRIVTTPAATRISRWRRRKALTRSATRWPASAKNSSGTAAPTANVTVSTTMGRPMLRGGPGHDYRGQHRAGARNVQHTQCQTETETIGLLHDPLLRNTGERLFQHLFDTREDQAETDRDQRDQCRPSEWRPVEGAASDSSAEPSRVTRLKLNTNPAITRYGRDTSRLISTATAPSAVGSGASGGAGGAGEEDHRQHRQDARRDAGDQASDETDQCERHHDHYSPPEQVRIGPLAFADDQGSPWTDCPIPCRAATATDWGASAQCRSCTRSRWRCAPRRTPSRRR